MATRPTDPRVGDAVGAPVVVTPDAVGLDLEIATVGSRAVAYLLDLMLLAAGILLLTIAQVMFGFGGFVDDWLAIAVILLLLFAWQFGYPIGFETMWRGRTLGKAAMGLRVVTVEGGPVGFRHATIRAAVAMFELTATLGVVALISSFASSRGQRLGDLAAGTLIVRERRAASDPRAEVFQPPHGLEHYTRQLDVSGLTPRDYAAVRDTLRRAPQLPVATRVSVTGQVAQTLLYRVTPAPPAGVTAEAWLRCVAAAVQARRAPVPPRAPAPARAPAPPRAPAPAAPTAEPGPAAAQPPRHDQPPASPTRGAAAPTPSVAGERGAPQDGFAPPD